MIDKEIKKAIESLNDGDKIQLELDKKNQVLKIWKLNLKKIEVRSKEWIRMKNKKWFCNRAKSTAIGLEVTF